MTRLLGLTLLLSACSEASVSEAAKPTRWTCDFEAPTQLGEVDTTEGPRLSEASGLVESRTNDGIFWSHNDDGSDGRLFAIAPSGTYVATWTIDRSDAWDLEDLARGPGPSAQHDYLYMGDIGDNAGSWGTPQAHLPSLLRFLEPDIATAAPGSIISTDVFTFLFPDEMNGRSNDAEAFFVDPRDGDVYIVTKRIVPARVFRARAPFEAGAAIAMEFVTEVSVPFPTGASMSVDGGTIALRSYWDVYLWHRGDDETVQEALQVEPCKISVDEAQGEAVALDTNEAGVFYTLSERGEGPDKVPLWKYAPR